jgi:hypothetical protein
LANTFGSVAQCSLNCDGNSTKSRAVLRAGQGRVLLVGEHAVQAVAELVEHGDHVVERQQRRLAGAGLVKLATL